VSTSVGFKKAKESFIVQVFIKNCNLPYGKVMADTCHTATTYNCMVDT
jgi:hypothetical protein